MATNTLTPMGLLQSSNFLGSAPNYGMNAYKIKKGYATIIGFGDLVATGTGGNQGYVTLAAFNATSALGVFCGVLPYFDLTQQQNAHGLNGSYQSTSNPSGDIDCVVISDPFAVFRAQVSGGPWAASWRGQNINFITGTNGAPNAAGISTLTLDGASVATTNTFPFRIVGLAGVPGGPQDPANTNPWIEVTLNIGVSEQMQALGI